MSEWTRIMDMHSGGHKKLQWEIIYIEADVELAQAYFEETYGRRCDHVTCDCCGRDYSVSWEAADSLEESSKYDRRDYSRRDEWDSFNDPVYIPVEEYVQRSNVLVVYAEELKDFVPPTRTRLQDIKNRLELGEYDFSRSDVEFLLSLIEESE